MAWCIAIYISPLGDTTQWIEVYVMIKKGTLTFEANFRLLLIRYQLFLITLDYFLTWKGATLISCMMDKYSINFVAIIHPEINDRAFGKLTNMLFACIIQRLFDETGIPKILGIDERVRATASA